MKQLITLVRVHNCLRALLAGAATFGFLAETRGATYGKANNTNSLNQAASWTNNAVPTSADIGQWDSTVTASNTVSLGADTNWAGLKVVNPGGLVTINAGNTLTLGASGIDLSSATTNLVLNCGVSLGAGQTWSESTGRSITFGGAVGSTGAWGLTNAGAGTTFLNAANSFNASTLAINSGTVQLGNANGLSGMGRVVVTNGATLTMGVINVTYANVPIFISGSGFGRGALYYGKDGGIGTWPGPIAINGATIGNFGASGGITLTNVISGSNGLSFFAGGASVAHVLTLNLSGSNTYSGSTTFNGTSGSNYRVNLSGGANRLPTTTAVTMNTTWSTAYGQIDFGGNGQTLAGLTSTFGSGPNTNYLISSSSNAPTVTLTTNGVAGAGASTFLVQGGNNGVLNISNITLNVANDPSYDLRTIIQNNSTINLRSGTYNSSFYTALGRTGNGTINVTNGLFNNGGELLMAYGGSGSGFLNVSGAGVADTHILRMGHTSSGNWVNLLSGGTIRSDRIYAVASSNFFTFNGGLLQSGLTPQTSGADWFNSPNVTALVRSNGAAINTQDKNGGSHNLTVANPLVGDTNSPGGGLTKLGAGMLTLSGTNTYTGNTLVNAGTLAVDGVIPAGQLLLLSGATLSGSGLISSNVIANQAGVATVAASINPGRAGTAGTLTVSNLTTYGLSTLGVDLSTDLTVGLGTNDLLVATNLDLEGATWIVPSFLAGGPSVGRYVVAQYSGSLINPTNLSLVGAFAPDTRYQASLDLATAGQVAINVGSTNAPAALVWQGDGVGNAWDINTSSNWLAGSVTNAFFNADTVSFTDAGSNTPAINLTGTLTPASLTVNSSNSYTFAGSGRISGLTGLTKQGSGTLILDNSGVNDFFGAITLSGGKLQLGNNDTAGSFGLAAITGSGSPTLAFNRTDAVTLNNTITGVGIVGNSGVLTLGGSADNASSSVTANNGGMVVLAKASSTSVHALGGGLTVNSNGVVRLGGSGGDQIYDSVSPILNGGTLDLGGLNETVTGVSGGGILTNGGTLTLSGILNANNGKLSIKGATVQVNGGSVPAVAVNGGNALELVSGSLSLGGYVGINGQLTILGGSLSCGTEVMPGYAANGGPGFVNVNGGTIDTYVLRVADVYNGTVFLNSGGTVLTDEIDQQGNGGSGVFYFNGGTLGVSTRNPNRAPSNWLHGLGHAYVSTNGAFITVAGSPAMTIPQVLESDPALAGLTDGGLTKQGAGSLTLSAAESYTGPTLVSAGTLVVNGSLGTNSTTVGASATLIGAGTNNGPVSVQLGGTLQPGSSRTSIGTMTVSNTLSLAGNTVMLVNRTNAQNASLLQGISAVTYGGTLTVSNSGPALVVGDTFTVFVATTYSGAFTNFVLPSLTAGLAWDKTQLATSGSLKVAALPAVTVTPATTNAQCSSTVILTANPTGTAPFSYQWYDNQTNAIAGETGLTLTLLNVHAANAGKYTVIVTNNVGSASAYGAVSVVDTLAPVITVLGANPAYLECHASFTDPGATALDACVGAVVVQTNGTVNTDTTGTNTITYLADDGNGNTSQATRTVIVQDTTPPEITFAFTNLTLSADVNCQLLMPDLTGSNYILATDLCNGALTITQTPTNNTVLALGTNEVVLAVSDSSGNTVYSTNTLVVADQTGPVITLLGASPLTNECHSAFVDPGATALDNCSGVATVSTNGAVDPDTVGLYSLDYVASDALGNTTTNTRLVYVVDSTAPVVTLNGDNPVTVECHGSFTDLGASAADACAGILTVSVIGTVNTSEPGLYTLTYSATDPSGNIGSTNRLVYVVDTIAPVVSWSFTNLTLSADINCQALMPDVTGTNYILAADGCSSVLHITQTPTNNAVLALGTNEVVLAVDDGNGNLAYSTNTVVVADQTAPVITRLGASSLTNECHGAFVDPGVTVSDNCSGVSTVSTNSTVDPNAVGIYTIAYVASDAAGNSATNVRTVYVVDTTAPVITECAPPQTVMAGYTGLATLSNLTSLVVATDACSGSVHITQQPPAGTDIPVGTNTVLFYVDDGNGNTNTCSSTVEVTAAPVVPPTILSEQVLEDGSFELTFSGPNGQSYQVIASPDADLPLGSWDVLTTGSFTATPSTWADTSATNYPARFYRVVSP